MPFLRISLRAWSNLGRSGPRVRAPIDHITEKIIKLSIFLRESLVLSNFFWFLIKADNKLRKLLNNVYSWKGRHNLKLFSIWSIAGTTILSKAFWSCGFKISASSPCFNNHE